MKSYRYGTDLKNKNGSLHPYGGLHVKHKLVFEKTVAKVLTNHSVPFTKVRFQNKNKRPRCIKVGNGPLINFIFSKSLLMAT